MVNVTDVAKLCQALPDKSGYAWQAMNDYHMTNDD
jgi:hypothetical protein